MKNVTINVSVASVESAPINGFMAGKARELGWQTSQIGNTGNFQAKKEITYNQPESLDEAMSTVPEDEIFKAILQLLDKNVRNRESSRLINALAMKDSEITKAYRKILEAGKVDLAKLDSTLTPEQRYSEEFWAEVVKNFYQGK